MSAHATPVADRQAVRGLPLRREVVRIATDRCEGCGACIRGCPATANRLRHGRAEIVLERCIGCGRCVDLCRKRRARSFASQWVRVQEAMHAADVVIMLAPSFPAAFDARPGQVVAALRRLGFRGVYEVAFGADLVSQRYGRSDRSVRARPLVSTPCPAAVELLRLHAPDVMPWLAPILSPMAAMGRLLKEKVRSGCWTVFAGPCSAKATEAENREVQPWVDAVITFAELRQWLASASLHPYELGEEDFDPPRSCLGGVMALSGGLAHGAGLDSDLVANRVTRICGPGELQMLVNRLRELDELGEPTDLPRRTCSDALEPVLYELLLCPGCIGGPHLRDDGDSGARLLSSRERVLSYVRARQDAKDRANWHADLGRYADLDLSRTFERSAPPPVAPPRANPPASARLPSEESSITVESSSSFVKTVAHEIKAPLGVVEGYLHLLREGAYEDRPEKRREVATRCIERTNALLQLLQNLLEIERRGPGVEVDRAAHEVDLVAIVNNAIAFHQAESERRALQVTIDVAPTTPTMPVSLPADTPDLDRVATNLISNAIKYNRHGGLVAIRLGGHGTMLTLDVEDTGIGMTQEEQKRLGEEFYRIKNAHTRHIAGSGLGITLVKKIVESCGGKLEIRSCAEVGSTFRVVLPLADRPSPTPPSEIPS